MRGKTRYLWGKDATGGLKPESRPSNYKYSRKIFSLCKGMGGWARLAGLFTSTQSYRKESNLKIPSLNEILDSKC